MSANKKPEPLMHRPFAGLDDLMDSIGTEPAETPRPVTLTPSGSNELLEEEDVPETFDPETDDGLDSYVADTSMLPPPVSKMKLTVMSGSGQLFTPGVPCEPFILEVRREDGTIPVGERVTFRIEYGAGYFDFQDESVPENGEIGAQFVPGPDEIQYAVACMIGEPSDDDIATFVGTAKAVEAKVAAAATQPTPELHAALEHALPTVHESNVPEAPEVARVAMVTEMVSRESAPVVEGASEAHVTEPELSKTSFVTVNTQEALAQAEAEARDSIRAAANEQHTLGVDWNAQAEARDTVLVTESAQGKPAPSDDEMEAFLQEGVRQSEDEVQTVHHALPPPAAIPREEKGAKAALKRSLRRKDKISSKRLIAFALGLALFVGMTYAFSGESEAPESGTVQVLENEGPMIKPLPSATAGAAPKTLIYRCEPSTQTTDRFGVRVDTLTCAEKVE